MIPDHAGVLHPHHSPLPAHAEQIPDLGRTHEADAPLGVARCHGSRPKIDRRHRLHAGHGRVGQQRGHVAAPGQRQQQAAIARHGQHVDQIMCFVGDAALIQPGPQRLLAAQRGLAQGIVNRLTPPGRIGQPAGRPQVSLLGQEHQEAGRLAVGRRRPQLRRDLIRLGRSRPGSAAQRHDNRQTQQQSFRYHLTQPEVLLTAGQTDRRGRTPMAISRNCSAGGYEPVD
jgi:hypothetical protein